MAFSCQGQQHHWCTVVAKLWRVPAEMMQEDGVEVRSGQYSVMTATGVQHCSISRSDCQISGSRLFFLHPLTPMPDLV